MSREESLSNTVFELLEKRFSPVIFSDKEVEDDKLFRLFEAARWAPSSFNDQPWNFIYGRKGKDQVYNTLFDLLMESNQVWAKYAPVLMLSVANMISPTTQKENRFAFHDTGMAMGNMLVQATSMNIYIHQMGGYSKKDAVDKLNIPQTHAPVAMIALGYRAGVKGFPDDLIKRDQKERTRRQIKDFAINSEFL